MHSYLRHLKKVKDQADCGSIWGLTLAAANCKHPLSFNSDLFALNSFLLVWESPKAKLMAQSYFISITSQFFSFL